MPDKMRTIVDYNIQEGTELSIHPGGGEVGASEQHARVTASPATPI
eukprot:gene30563-5279_t